ncbi:UNVERIFIED_CONTAM: hypothetical protein HDU68_003395, partial [Siphonaria sp. JEL0065]
MLESGCLSDPEGMSMYFKVRDDREGLPCYRCIRGTSRLESFQKLEMIFDSWNAGTELVDASLCIIRHWTNILTSKQNRPNFPKLGHFDHYLIDQIQVLTKEVTGRVLFNWWPETTFGQKTDSKFVSTLLPSKREFISDSDTAGYKPMFTFLARATESKVSYLPVHSSAEWKLFSSSIEHYLGAVDGKAMSSISKVDWHAFANDWNIGQLWVNKKRQSPLPEIFKKTPSQ